MEFKDLSAAIKARMTGEAEDGGLHWWKWVRQYRRNPATLSGQQIVFVVLITATIILILAIATLAPLALALSGGVS